MAQDFVVRTVRGLEWVAAAEVAELPGASVTAMRDREVLVSAEPSAALTQLRCVDDVFATVATRAGVGTTKDQLAVLGRWVVGLDLGPALRSVRSIRSVPRCPVYDVVVSLRGGRRFTRYDAEDSVGAALAATLGPGYRSRRYGPVAATDLTVRCFLVADRLTLTLRLGSRPLHRRDYKQATGPGTLHPPVAAAMVRLIGTELPLLDPCCGDGTIPIESGALMGAASGAARTARVIAGDIDASRLTNARANADRAGVEISFVRADAAVLPVAAGSVGAVVSNPPWAVGVDAAGGLAGCATGEVDARRLVGEIDRVLSPGGTLCLLLGAGGSSDPSAIATRLTDVDLSVGLTQPLRVNGRIAHLICAARSGTWPAGGPPTTSREITLNTWGAKTVNARLTTDSDF